MQYYPVMGIFNFPQPTWKPSYDNECNLSLPLSQNISSNISVWHERFSFSKIGDFTIVILVLMSQNWEQSKNSPNCGGPSCVWGSNLTTNLLPIENDIFYVRRTMFQSSTPIMVAMRNLKTFQIPFSKTIPSIEHFQKI